MNKKQRKMVALKVLETSGVDHPAHLEEGWIVMKNAGTNTEDSVSETAKSETMEQGLEEAYIERVVELEKALAESEERVKALADEVEKAKAPSVEVEIDEDEEEDDYEDEDMMKSLPEPVREMLKKAADEATAAREELRKEREIRADEQFVAKASGWKHLTVDPKEVGPALRRLTEMDAKLAESVEKALEAANAQAESAAIFDEIGRGAQPTNSDAYGKVQSLAKAAFEAGEFATLEQAIAGTVTKNPELYAAYRAER